MVINNINEKYTRFLMNKEEEDLYDIEKYSEDELFQMLDLNNPTDRELEAKLLYTIEKYDELKEDEAKKIKSFFEDAYAYFFENDEKQEVSEMDGNVIEGMETQQNDKKTEEKSEVFDKDAQKDSSLVQTTSFEYTGSKLNPLLKETQKRVLQLDSQFRNYGTYPSSTDYIINLSEVLNNVVALRLHSVSIPYTWYNVSNVYNANYFQLLGNVDGLTGVYDLKFEIPAGSYDTEGLITALNTSIQKVKSENTDIDFGTTGFIHDTTTSKVKFTIDIQQIYNETNFYLYFGEITNAFDNRVREKTIPGFLGFANMVIPRFQSSNANIITAITSVTNAYSLESIYSNFQNSLAITGRLSTGSGTTPPSTLEYNSFDPNAVFYLVIDDVYNNTGVTRGNNYFTIYNYDGPRLYDASSSTILDTIRVEFGDVSGLYTRSTLLELINRSLLSNQFLSNNAFLHQFDISYNSGLDASNNETVTTMQRFQMMILLNRETTTKKENSKVAVVFPDENLVFDLLSDDDKLKYWSGPLWTGQQSCFLFDEEIAFTSPNSLKAEISPIQTKYDIISQPELLLRCIKEGYNNSANNRKIEIDTSTATGNDGGYILNDYIGVYNNQENYLNSEINTKLKNITSQSNSQINNGYVKAKAFYDVGIKRSRIQFDILTFFSENDYQLDQTNGPFGTLVNTGDLNENIISIGTGTSDTVTSNIITGYNTNGNGVKLNYISTNVFPLDITNTNNKIIVNPKSTVPGLSDLSGVAYWGSSGYTIEFPVGKYRTPDDFVRMVNDTFAKIQGTTDSNGNKLYGLNMSQSKIEIFNDNEIFFTYVIKNKITQDDYVVYLYDYELDSNGALVPNTGTGGGSQDYAGYVNNYYDVSGNERYSVERTIDSSANVILSYNESSNPGITGNSWNAFLGFTDVSYSLNSQQREIRGSRDIMHDISKTILIDKVERKNHSIFFTPQSSVKGLTDSSGVKKIEINVPDGIYTNYGLYNAINIKLRNNEQTTDSIVYSTFDRGVEYSVFQLSINQKYTAEDYVLSFYNEEETETQNIKSITTNSFQTTTWDVTIGWLLGFRSNPQFNLNSTVAATNLYADSNNYIIDASTNIVTLEGDTCLDLFLFKNLYLIVDDFTQNHLNDGLITGVRNNPNAERPKYSSSATRVCDPLTKQNQSSIFNSSQPGMGLTEKQLFAANKIQEENVIINSTKLYSDPPYVKDMFAMIPLKVSGLKQGEVFTEYGGTLQDNDRKYFGPVNITKLRIQLLNDHGDVINLNGNNWSFSLVFEYLYNMKGL